MIPFRPPTPPPRLQEGYRLLLDPWPDPRALNHLLAAAGDAPRTPERWQRALERSLWHLGVEDPQGHLVGFVRATSDLALNANLWDLSTDPAEPTRDQVMLALVQASLARLRRELSGCSVSLSAPPGSLKALERQGFIVDPGGIRAMGLWL
ncbi:MULTISPECIES: hypothetical protein [Aphanothece]|uniref:hypothetical protein n=1 Tax=Aphanothece TaxID=1121 RepID=UPI00398471F8